MILFSFFSFSFVPHPLKMKLLDVIFSAPSDLYIVPRLFVFRRHPLQNNRKDQFDDVEKQLGQVVGSSHSEPHSYPCYDEQSYAE